jgi:hypothetical protein
VKKPRLGVLLLSLLCVSLSRGQEPAGRAIEIKGDGRPAEAEQLVAIWLYPEDYEGKMIKLHGFLFEPENFEYFPDENGYLFSFEPANLGRDKSVHPHVGNATFLSREKLNFFCSTSDGQRIRRLFKHHQANQVIAADVELKVEKRNYVYLGVVTSFKPTKLAEE